jgi:hypothetical protein
MPARVTSSSLPFRPSPSGKQHLEPYGTAAATDKSITVFGPLSLWCMGEHGSPRMDTSEHVWFANDQLAVRFIEEIDFDYMSKDAIGLRQVETINGDYREFADVEWVPWVRSTLNHFRRLTV